MTRILIVSPAAFQSLWTEFLRSLEKAVEAAVFKALAARELTATLPAPLIDKRALAQALGISTAKVDRMTAKGLIPFVLVGDVRRYDVAAIRTRLAAQTPSVQTRPVPATATTEVRLLSRPKRAS